MFKFLKKIFGKKNKNVETDKGPVCEWSYQRFAKFYDERIFPDPEFNNKMSAIIQCVNIDRMERLDEIAEKTHCNVPELILKIRYLKNKRVIDNIYIDKVNRVIRPCTVDDNEILNKYYDMIYKDHLSISEMSSRVPNYYNKPLPIIQEDVYKDIRYLYDRDVINGVKLDDSRKEIIYYTVEKKKIKETYASINCPKCGSIVFVPKKGSRICDYCGADVQDNSNIN